MILAVALAAAVLAAEPASAPPAPRTLVVADDVSDPPTLDPLREFAEKNHSLCQQIFDPLVRLKPDGTLEPALAVSWTRLDPLRVRFTLREGVRFHDGEPFDAEAVRYTIESYLDPKTGFPARGFLGPLLRAEVVDPRTVDIVTAQPDGLLLRRLAAFVLIVPPKSRAALGEEFGRRPVGTGAFRFASWVKGKSIVLEANREYWLAGYPKSDRLVFRFLPAARQLSELLAGRLDVVSELPGTTTMAVAESTAAVVVKQRTLYTIVSGFDTSRGPLRDKRVRQALNYAVDRRALIRYDQLGNGEPLATFAMPGDEGYDASVPAYPYDPERARALLREAGYAKGLKLRGLVKSTAEHAAGIIKSQWKRVGVDFEYVVMDEAQITGNPKAYREKVGDVQLGGVADPVAASFFLPSLMFFSQSPYAMGANPDFDARLIEVAVELDDARRKAASSRLQRFIRDEALGLFTYQKIRTYGVRRGVAFVPYVTGMPYFFATTAAPR